MQILTSYLLRAHAGPFLFALSTLTGLIFLNAVAQRLENLAGKGLTWDVIGEFLLLSLPHTVALTLPMAVLVAVLYAFSELTANNEITAIKAGGIPPQRMMLPLLGVGVIIGGTMLLFNDRVLPEANHRLKNLLLDVNRKSPTFVLREQVVNPIRTDETGAVYYLTAARIDNQTNEMADVAIYDSNDPLSARTTYAERGKMAFNEARTDLYLTLYDGVVFETTADRPGSFHQIRFDTQVLPIRGVGNEMERQAGGCERSDREMTLAMLDSAATERAHRLDSIVTRSENQTRAAVLQALGRTDEEPAAGSSADTMAGGGGGGPARAGLGRVARDIDRQVDRAADRGVDRGVDRGADRGVEGGEGDEGDTREARDREQLPSLLAADHLTRRTYVGSNTHWAVKNTHQARVNSYRVEIHKKYTLAFACVVFVLLGGPLAIRFPRGGLGLVIAAWSVIFAIYWAGLIGGENLADKGVAPPAVTMWIPNVVFGGVGLWLFFTMGREAATQRGGGWDDVVWTARKAVTAPLAFVRERLGSKGSEGEKREATAS